MSGSPAQAQPAVVEIAGVAGSGKSTLARVMCVNRGFGSLDDTLRMREPCHLRLVAHSVPRVAWLLKGSVATRRTPSWTELKLVIYLMEWNRRLARTRGHHSKATIMDQGPLYALARLGHLDPPVAGTEPRGDWWTATVGTWANSLDAVIWLDAPNDVLWQRVNTRAQAHAIKGTSPEAAMTYVDRYRVSYERVLSAMDRPGGPLVLRYDTSRLSPEEIGSDAIEQLARREPRSGRAISEGGP